MLVDHPWPVKKQEMIPMLGNTEMMPLIKPTLQVNTLTDGLSVSLPQ